MSTIRATYVQHGSSPVPNITLNASGQVIVASGLVSSGTFAAPSGTAAAPGVYFDGDTDTGLYSPGANQVSLSTNGTERLRVDGTGVAKLYGDGSTQCKIYGHYGGGLNWIIGNEGNQNLSINAFDAYPVVLKTSGSERLRIDSSGRLLVGTTSDLAPDGYASKIQSVATDYTSSITLRREGDNPSGTAVNFVKTRSTSVGGNTTVQNGDTLGAINFYGADGTDADSRGASIYCAVDGTPGADDMPGRLVFSTTQYGQSSPTEAVRIDESRNLLVGRTDANTTGAGLWIYNNAGTAGRINFSKTASGTLNGIANYHSGTYVGGVDYSNTATSFPTSSDRRLKKDIANSQPATPIVEQISVVSHGWINDDSIVPFGVIAQELHAVAPQAVTAGDDNEDDIQKTWGVDYSKLVPILVKALQESNQRIETLEAKVAALETP